MSSSSSLSETFGFGMESVTTQSNTSTGATSSAKALYERRKSIGKTMVARGEVSEYQVEHLLHCNVDRKQGILTVDDSLRKLKLLDARGKIWSQEMVLYVDDAAIKLQDLTNNEDLESFPIGAVQHVQPVINASDCSFNSILALVVRQSDQKSVDIHLFQCPFVPAEVIGADVSSAQSDSKRKKKSRPDTLRRHRDVIEATGSRREGFNVQQRVQEWRAREAEINSDDDGRYNNGRASPLSSPRQSIDQQQTESPEYQAFKIHRDVQLLNHALDDVEVFVAQIKKSTEATQELTVRAKSKKSKKQQKAASGDIYQGSGIGILQLRSRFPPPEMYVDCFQKFKFCFNQMAKLRRQLASPNSVELVHFLFKPLRIVIGSCAMPGLAATVETPLLTQDTLDFLRNCCTSQELQLLQDLGKCWNLTRADFPKDHFFPPYIPKFRSGWEPPPLPFREAEPSQLAAAIASQANHVAQKDDEWKRNGANIEDVLQSRSPREAQPNLQRKPSIAPTRLVNGAAGVTSPADFKQHVKSHVARNMAAQGTVPAPRKLCRAMYDFEARNEHELTVRMDDLLDVLDDEKTWWKVRNRDGLEGHVPSDLMLLISSASKPQPNNIPPPPPVNQSRDMIPPPPPPPPITSNPSTPPTAVAPKFQPLQLSSAMLAATALKKAPPRQQNGRSKQEIDHLQQELQQRVAAQRQRNFVIPKKNDPARVVALSGDSTPDEVRRWLLSHSFSNLTVDSLSVLNGAQLFSLTKNELVKICEDEGPRVHSQLLVQKSSSSSSFADPDLDKIMKKRRSEIYAKGGELGTLRLPSAPTDDVSGY